MHPQTMNRSWAGGWLAVWIFLAALSSPAASTPANIQFDVFPGYDGIVPEATWFPIVCEIKNDGPSFTATIVIKGGQFSQGQVRKTVVELPTKTLKRVVIPVFSSARSFSSWDLQLLDERGRIRAEQLGLRPRKQVAVDVPVVGALSRTAGGLPTIRPVRPQQGELQPSVARLLTPIFPDNPLALEGMTCLYLNSEKASELGVTQSGALVSWVAGGGHLVLAIEQVGDLAGATWLQNILPVTVSDIQSVTEHQDLHDWLIRDDWIATLEPQAQPGVPGQPRQRRTWRIDPSSPFSDLLVDPTFEAAPLQVARASVSPGATVLCSAGKLPLMVQSHVGRGRVTVLLFSPEREPARSWKHLPSFWAKLADVPKSLYLSSDYYNPGGWSSDGVVGAMIDSRQVHKLPIGWLFLLLLVYLAVIGPLDYYWLKRLKRPMLTWITFPCYVVLFSLVIYLIGYKLRAGVSEWNELHVVDVLQNGPRTALRGRSFLSVYSPVNQKYPIEAQQKIASLRGEFVGTWSGGQDSENVSIIQSGDKFKGELFVPVWTSQLFCNDWWDETSEGIHVAVKAAGDGWEVSVDNRTRTKLDHVQLVIDQRIHSLESIPSKSSKTSRVSRTAGLALIDYVDSHGGQFSTAASSRRRAFGESEGGRLDDLPNAGATLSFIGLLRNNQQHASFVVPRGLDLSPRIKEGRAVLLAWSDDFSPTSPLPRFKPTWSHRQTLWRVPVDFQVAPLAENNP